MLSPTHSCFPCSLLGLLVKFLLQIGLAACSSSAMSVRVLKQNWPPSCIFRANASQLIASSPDDPEKVRELLTEPGWSGGRELAKARISTGQQDPESSRVLVCTTRASVAPRRDKTIALCKKKNQKAGGLLGNCCLCKKRWVPDMKLIRIITFSIWLLYRRELVLQRLLPIDKGWLPPLRSPREYHVFMRQDQNPAEH